MWPLNRPQRKVDLDCDDGDDTSGPEVEWWLDEDGDGVGAGLLVGPQCEQPSVSSVPALGDEDCDDADSSVYPGAFDECGDGVDANCDGDDTCVVEICTDGVDNDFNGLRDCLDPACSLEPICDITCADEVLTDYVPFSYLGSTRGAGNDTDPTTCAFSNADDLAFGFVAPADGTYVFDTGGSSYDTVLYLLDGCGGREIDCNDDAIGLQSRVSATMQTGDVVIIVVDGYSANNGNFSLNVSN